MSTALLRENPRVTETQWERLYRIVERRRSLLGLTLKGLQAVGGPSPAWVQKLKTMEGEPTDRMRRPMRMLDAALRWRPDTSWELVALDRSGWSRELLGDEEESLLERVDEADEFALVVAARIRSFPEGRERDDAMRRVLAALGIEP
jgi:hypothetical protein